MLFLIILLVVVVCSLTIIRQRQNFQQDVMYLNFTELFNCEPDVDVGELNDMYITDEHEEFLGIESHGTGSVE